jgi:signal transduction histidine kinase
MRAPGRRRFAWPGLPAPTIRLRLTATYAAVFLITGAVLLTIGYALVRHNLAARGDFREIARRLGLPPPLGLPFAPRLLLSAGSPEARLALAVRQQLQDAALHRLLVAYIAALAAMTAVAALAGWLIAGRALRPLRAIIATAQKVSVQNLGERIALTGPADELKELADTFDRMLARLDHAFASQRHFVAGASHELRTPLTIMRTEIDVSLGDPAADVAELRRMGEAVRETVDRCERLIESLLVLARSEAAAGAHESLDLARLAAECVTDVGPEARRAGVRLEPSLDEAPVRGDPRLLERMIANLLENGIRHNQRGGRLRITTATDGGRAVLRVTGGSGEISPELAARLSEPFLRLNRTVEGFGLGLSIVRTVVEAHEGTVTVTPLAGGGLDVRVALAVEPHPAADRIATLTGA